MKIKWGIIGCGDVVNRLLKDSLSVKNKSEVLSVMSIDVNEAKNFAKKHKILNYTNSVKDIVNNKNINAIYIACPPNKHFEYIIKCSQNKKLILCEKPLVLSSYQLRKIINTCKKNKTALITCFYRRYQKKFLFIKKISKKIGKILYFKIYHLHKPESHPTAPIYRNKKNKIPWRFDKKISGGGNFFDMGTHYLDMINFLLGRIKYISSYYDNFEKLYDVEDTLSLNIKLENNIVGTGLWSSISPFDEELFEIYGSKGKLSFSLNNSDKIVLKTKNKTKKYFISLTKPYHKPLSNFVINKFQTFIKKRKYYIPKNDLNVSTFQLRALEL